MESGSNTTSQMFRQALAEVPDPSSFLQTPTHVDDSDLSWEIEDEEDLGSVDEGTEQKRRISSGLKEN